ncbi:MAG: hypothetical protein Q7U60_12975 [Candidatus Methanoperedens sp.]|nr:hypothetical protein [Candidatus Methanoperedens sp.]
MNKPVLILFMVLVFASILPLSEGNPGRPFDITSLTINFDKTDAVFTVNYDLGKLPKMYVLIFGSKSIEPRIKAIFPDFDYEIVKMDQDKTILRIKNVSRLEKGYYLHDSRRLGTSINTLIIYTPDSTRPTEYFNTNSTPNKFYRS